MPDQRRPLAAVVGRNCHRIRSELGITQDELARYARDIGLRWTASKVGDFERGRRAPTFATVLAVSLALARAQADLATRSLNSAAGRTVTLADLVEFAGPVILTPDGPDPRGDAIVDVCRGQPSRSEPEELWGADELAIQHVHKQITETALSYAIVDGYFDPDVKASELATIRQRSGLAEDRLAQRLNISRDRLAALSFLRWSGKTFSEERDRRCGPEANQQKRGRVSRELQAELKEAINHGDS